MEGFINEIRVPSALFKEGYTLEEDVNIVRNKLARLDRSKETEKDLV